MAQLTKANTSRVPHAKQLTTGAAARLMGVSQCTVIRLCESGAFKAWRVSEKGWWRIDGAALAEYIDKRNDGWQ